MYKLLIADDEQLEIKALRLFIEQSILKFDKIIECGNGREAVQAVLLENPDIAILDIKMPEMTGDEAVEHIRATTAGCKVIFSTAYSDFDYAFRAIKLGACDFMLKPVSKNTLIQVLQKTIGQLDEERKNREQEKRMTKISALLEKQILSELARGNYDEETLWFLDTIGVENAITGSCLFASIRYEHEEKRTELDKILREGLSGKGYKHILSVDEKAMGAVVFLDAPSSLSAFRETAFGIFDGASRDVHMNYNLNVGPWFSDISQIECSYAKASGRSESEGCGDFSTAVFSGRDKSLPPEIESVYHYIRQNYRGKVTLDDVASSVGFSKYYISRLFKSHTGMTIIDCLIQTKLEKAKNLLENSKASIKEISYAIGYSDPNYFMWSFKKYIWTSPSKYRECHCKKNGLYPGQYGPV
jgi:YesN/AraC family two-component response regulator